MGYKNIETVVSSAVASAATITFAYPAGFSAGSFAGAHAHKMWVDTHQKMYSAPNDFTVAFGTSAVVTYNGSTTIPAGSRVNAQFDMLGTDNREPEKATANAKVIKAGVHLLDLGSPVTLDADGVAASQTVTGANTAFVLNGALVQNGVAVFDSPRNVVGAWTNTAVLTITGTDVDGNAVVEKTASGTSHTGSKAFKTVTSVTTSATVTGATVGTGVKIGLPVYVPDASYVLAELKDGVALPRQSGVVIIDGRILDAGTASSTWAISPVAGRISKLTTILHGTISGADEVVSMEVNGTAVDGLSITIANSGSAVGDVDTDSPTAGHASAVVAVGDKLEVINTGASTGTALVTWQIEIDTTAAGQMDGTFVAGVTSKATATTGDTRGTYSPSTAPNGATQYALLVALPDPGNYGVPQYTG